MGISTTNQGLYFVISGLSFTPRIVMLKDYSSTYMLYSDACVQYDYNNNPDTAELYKIQTYVAITTGGFVLPFPGTSTWYAFEYKGVKN